MEQLKDGPLEEIAERISDRRAEINALIIDEKEDERAALARMRFKDLTTFQHAGVEFARVPGEEKLRVRTSKATAEVEGPSDATGDDE